VKILLVGEISGTRDGQEWPPRGSVVELPEDEAVQLCDRGMARPVVETEMVEVAVVPAETVEERGPLTTKTGPGRRAPKVSGQSAALPD
jgi:hypothetical protein